MLRRSVAFTSHRYMGDPATNAEGYARSAIRNMTGFHNASFFLAHGSGDDNVHYLNSANLLDRFTQARVRDFRCVFTRML